MTERDVEIKEAYRKAIYVVCDDKEKETIFRVGERSAAIGGILEDSHADCFAFITAFNPRSEIVPDDENNARQAELKEVLLAENLSFLEGYGTDEREIWQREKSFFIFNISRDKAIEIGRKYGQNAIVCGAKDKEIELVWCD